MFKLLVIGGTLFLGRAAVEAALARGHSVTLFNRGQTDPDLFPGAEHVRGDRETGLGALAGRRWDAVIDTCGYVPATVRRSAEALAGAVGRYCFVSTVGAYGDLAAPGADEGRALSRPEPGADVAAMTPGTQYGLLKALCEAEVEAALPGRALLVRPGLIVGPRDPTQRYGWWVRRIGQGGTVLAPGFPEAQAQLIDARDLADWMVRAVEDGAAGPFNAVGPESLLQVGELFEGIRASLGSDARFEWVDDAFLLARSTPPFHLPFWTERTMPPYAAAMRIDGRKAVAAGLRFRGLAETARDTAAWNATLPADHVWRNGLAREREAELLAEWRARS